MSLKCEPSSEALDNSAKSHTFGGEGSQGNGVGKRLLNLGPDRVLSQASDVCGQATFEGLCDTATAIDDLISPRAFSSCSLLTGVVDFTVKNNPGGFV